ncbi:MAG: hypothetical protein ACE1ZG_07675 [Gammaproteobacteria bacterium]
MCRAVSSSHIDGLAKDPQKFIYEGWNRTGTPAARTRSTSSMTASTSTRPAYSTKLGPPDAFTRATGTGLD